MATKYDTNPLDPEFPEKARVAAEAGATQYLPNQGGETRQFAPNSLPTEEQTRRFTEPDIQGYSAPYANPYNGQYVPANYQTVSFGNVDQSPSRKVAKVGLPENIMTAVPYFPWFLGLVGGILMLVFLPKSEAKVRFHAAQGVAAHVAILLISALLGGIGQVTDFARFGSGIFNVVMTVMLIVFAYKAWKGRPVHIESIEDLTNWLEDKISPKQ